MNADLRAEITRWLTDLGLAPLRLDALAGGASPRTYWRVQLPEGSRVVMALPQDATPTEHGAVVSADLPWVRIGRWLAGLGLPVPFIERVDLDAGLLLIEDLGDVRFYDLLEGGADRFAAYREALELLARFQVVVASAEPPGPIPTFSREHLLAELAEFEAMALEARLGVSLSPGERTVLGKVGEELARELQPEVLAHRDFQSHNLMVTARGLVLIDFQDAFFAPRTYDLVALLRDSYVRLTPGELDALLAHHASRTGASLPALADAFHLQTIQRKLKDSGRFETLARRGKPHFLAFFADSIAYVVHALRASGRFPDLLDLLVARLPEARAALS